MVLTEQPCIRAQDELCGCMDRTSLCTASAGQTATLATHHLNSNSNGYSIYTQSFIHKTPAVTTMQLGRL